MTSAPASIQAPCHHNGMSAWPSATSQPLHTTTIEDTALEALCRHVLDIHAPAALVHAQAAGIALERLVAARLAVTYVERFGRTTGPYDAARVRAVVRQLQGAGCTVFVVRHPPTFPTS
jgi:hypothetical protein